MEEIPLRHQANSGPRIIPVMDVRAGIVVRAIAGRREDYRPLASRLTDSTDPRVVAEALRAAAGTSQIYLADLDAIAGGQPNRDLLTALERNRFHVWVDAGVRTDNDVPPLFEAGADVVIAGLETLQSPSEIRSILRRYSGIRIAFSLDLRSGEPALESLVWPMKPTEIIESIVASGLKQLIILDLSRVGVGRGIGTEDLCAWAKAKYPHLDLIAGGGVCGPEDLPRLQAAGVSAVLVASALHDGRFGLPGASM